MKENQELRFSALRFGDYKTPWMCARQFLNNARPFFLNLSSDVNEVNLELGRRLPEMSVNATNLIFSTELYLKTVVNLEQGRISHTHNVAKLFDLLSEKNRREITNCYLETDSTVKRNISYYSLVNKTRKPERSDPKKIIKELIGRENDSNLALKTVLLETGDSYHWWRYIFQGPLKNQEYSVIILHFDRLITFCEVMDRGINAAHEKISSNS